MLANAERQAGRKAVVLVDEYDKPLLDVMGTPQEEVNRNILRAFYATFKTADEHLRFVLLTGVTKFSQVSVFSGFNQPRDISMVERYDTLCGITTEELHTIFAEPISQLAQKRGISVEQVREKLRERYDGYHFSEGMHDVYNPYSILCVMDYQKLADYWFSTATPSYLIRLMEHFSEDISKLVSEYHPASEFVDYRADVEQPLPMLYQSGYLTIKDYDPENEVYRVDFPNKEVSRGFLTLLTSHYLKPAAASVGAWSSKVSRLLKRGELEEFMKEMTAFMAGIPYDLRRKESERQVERDFQYTFYLIMRLVGDYTVYAEKRQSQGRVDCVIETPQHVYIFEFKRDGKASEALLQIHECGYAREYAADSRTVHLVGCNFSTRTGTIDDWAVE